MHFMGVSYIMTSSSALIRVRYEAVTRPLAYAFIHELRLNP